MKRLFVFTQTLLLSIYSLAQIRPLYQQELFVTTDTSRYPYRIPAITQIHRGPLLAVCDYRICGSDIGFGRVDLVCRLSNNNGKSWKGKQYIIQGSGTKGTTDCGYGDAAIVADTKSKNVLLLCVSGNTIYWAKSTTRKNPNRISRLYSYDGGKTWSKPEDITEQLYSLFDSSKIGPVQSMFVGSGRIFQSKIIRLNKYYRIYAALCARPGGNRVIYSDDFGKTWLPLGSIHTSPAPNGDEPKCAELPDGSVVLSSRAKGGRIFNIFHYTNKNYDIGYWGKPAFSCENNHGIIAQNNSTNGGILILPAKEKNIGRKCHIALQTVPIGPGRLKVGVYYKILWDDHVYDSPEDFAKNWRGPLALTINGSAYSELVEQKDGSIGILLEQNSHKADYSILYQNFSLEQLTQGRFIVR